MLIITTWVLLGCRTAKPAITNDDTIESEDQTTDLDGDGYTESEDCDDGNAAIHPGVTEICDGIDNNCDGQVDEDTLLTFYMDADGDGFGDPAEPLEACQQQPNTVPNDRDCDDTNSEMFPSAEEVCDGVDNNCDGDIDEGVTLLLYADNDGDGFGDISQPIETCQIETGYVTDSSDCDDTTTSVSPDVSERCDGIDNNCDGLIDDSSAIDQVYFYKDADNDGFGDPLQGAYFCSAPNDYVENDLDCDDIDSAIHPNAAEFCDGIDNDCDTLWDELDPDIQNAQTYYLDADNDGYGDPSNPALLCSLTSGWSSNDQDCNDTEALAYSGAIEVCDGVDNDCNGLSDDDDANIDPSSQQTFYMDADNDGFGDPNLSILQCTQGPHSSNAQDCNDQDANLNPQTLWYFDADNDGFGNPNISLQICSQPVGYTGNDDDCDDQDASLTPNTEWYTDADNDGFGDATLSSPILIQCLQPSGLSHNQLDCDDQNSLISPAAAIGCEDIDANCDGLIDNDNDGDGWSDITCGGSDCNDNDANVYDTSGTVEECAVLDCDDLFQQDPTLADGVYWIDPDGNGAFEAYCLYDTNALAGWTLVMRAINADIPYGSNLWTSNTLFDETNWSLNQQGYAKYEAFNRVPFTEIRTAQPTDFTNGYTETFSIGYSSALDLFSGPGVSLTLNTSNEAYFLGLITNGYYVPYGCAQHRAYGFNQQAYLGTGFISSGSYCDWNGGARWGMRYNASHSGTGNHQGIGWGNYTTIGYSPQTINQLMWVR